MTTCYKRLSFTNDEENILIKFIQEHPPLWDANDPEYVNGELRKGFWISIARELNKSVPECRRKWRFIRDYYIHKRRRTFNNTVQNGGKYGNLHFLDKITVRKFSYPQKRALDSSSSQQGVRGTKRSTTSHIERVQKFEQEYNESDGEYEYTPDTTFENVTMERVEQSHEYILDDEEELESNTDSARNFACDSEYRYDEESTDHTIGSISKAEDQDEEHLMEMHPDCLIEQSKHEAVSMRDKAIDLFFESMAAAVKTFPQEFLAEVKLKVLTAVNEVEAKVNSSASGN